MKPKMTPEVEAVADAVYTFRKAQILSLGDEAVGIAATKVYDCKTTALAAGATEDDLWNASRWASSVAFRDAAAVSARSKGTFEPFR